jgi:flagella basal body P-ring formation protein FlgA
MTGRLLLAALGLGAALAAAPAAWSADLITLKPQVISGRTITLGDLFDGTGTASNVVIGSGAPPGESAVLDANIVRQVASQHGLDWDNPEGIQRIVVPRAAAGVSGRMVDALTYTRSLSAGDIVQPSDLTFTKVANFAVPIDAPRDADEIIGKAARRPLRSGAAAADHDVTSPQVIKANDEVQVTYRSGGINLTLEGKAMGSAVVGETVDIQNPASKKTIQAVASGPDQAIVGPEAEQLRSRSLTGASQFASLP